MSAAPNAGAARRLALLGALAVALGVRLVYLRDLWASPFSPGFYLPIDAGQIHRWAIAWLEGGWPPPEPFFRAPLYTLFVGAVYDRFGPSPLPVLALQALLGAVSCWLVHGIARDLFPDGAIALVATWVCALYGTLVYFDAQLLSGSLDVFLQLLVLRLLLVGARRPGLGWWLAAGGALGLSAILRGGILLFVPVVLLWIGLLATGRAGPARAERPLRPIVARSVALLVPLAALLLPVAAHNVRYDRPGAAAGGPEALRRVFAGEFVVLAANSGINFYLGNHWSLRAVNRLDHPDHLAVYDRVRLEPSERGIVSIALSNAYLVDATLREVAERPGDWLRLLGTKLLELANGSEIARNTSLYADREHSAVLSALLWRLLVAFPSGLVLPLAGVGILLARRDWRRHLLVWGNLACQAIFLLAFFVTARYRLPMLPLLAIYAAAAAVELWQRLRSAQRPAARLLGALLLLLVLCNLPVVAIRTSHHHVDHYNLGLALWKQGEFESGEEHLRRALALSPEDPQILLALCELLRERRRAREGQPHCEEAVRVAPDSAGARYALGSTLEALGERSQALSQYLAALELTPGVPEIEAAARRVSGGAR